MDNKLVHESRSDVEASHGVVEVVLLESLADVLIGAEDGLVGAVARGRLEEGVHDALPSGDVLLVVGDIVRKTLPLVRVPLLVDVFPCHHCEPVGLGALAMVVHGRGHLLLELLPEEVGRRRSLYTLHIHT